ncbi:MAG: DNA polymerase domain-containing protein, partial [bacterium]
AQIPGCTLLDQYRIVKHDYIKMPDYKLNTILKEYLGKEKIDMPYEQMFKDWEEGDPDKLKKIADYCIWDSESLIEVNMKRNDLMAYEELANLNHTPLNTIINEGSSFKIVNFFYHTCRNHGYLYCPKSINKNDVEAIISNTFNQYIKPETLSEDKEDTITDFLRVVRKKYHDKINCKIRKLIEVYKKHSGEKKKNSIDQIDIINKAKKSKNKEIRKAYKAYIEGKKKARDDSFYSKSGSLEYGCKYTGATVFQGVTDYHEDPVAVFDVARMYPSIMIAFNLSSNTHITSRKILDKLKNNPKYNKKYKVKKFTYYLRNGFKKAAYFISEGRDAIMKYMLTDIINKRTEYKAILKKIDKGKEPKKYATYYNKERAVKINANTVYGVSGCVNVPIYNEAVAAITADKGRDFIGFTSRVAKKELNTHLKALYKAKGLKYKKYDPLIYGDTDSVFIKVKKDAYESQEELIRDMLEKDKFGDKLCKKIGSEYGYTDISIEPEKVLTSLIILSKKRYIGKIHEYVKGQLDFNGRMYNSGDILKRRDYPQTSKEVYKKYIEEIYKGRPYEDIFKDFVNWIESIAAQEYPLEKYMISTSFKGFKSYKNKTALPLVLAEIMKKEDPGNKPEPGERFYYFYSHVDPSLGKRTGLPTKTAKIKICDTVMPVEIFKKKKMDLCMYLYIQGAFNALKPIFINIMGMEESYFEELKYYYSYSRDPRVKCFEVDPDIEAEHIEKIKEYIKNKNGNIDSDEE